MLGQASEQLPESSFTQGELDVTDSFQANSLQPIDPILRVDRQQAACNTESELEPFFTLSLDMLCIAGFDGYFKRLNPAWEKVLGYTQSELLSNPYLEFVHPDDRAATMAAAQKLIREGATIEFEHRYLCKNGSYRWLRCNARAFPEKQRIYCVAHDITESKQAEASQQRQALVFESISDGVILTDLDGRIVDWNPAAERMFGYIKGEVLGQTPEILHKPEETTGLTQRIIDGMVRDGRWSGEITFIRKDGTEGVCETIVTPLHNQAGQIIATIGVNHEITTRKQTSERLRLLESVVVNANDMVMITDAEPIDKVDPSILYVNESFTRMTGYAPEEVQGKPPRILQGPRTDRSTLDKIHAALQTWRPVRAELINYRKDGSEFWVELNISPVTDDTGSYTHWISIQREITDRKLAEQALQAGEQRYATLAQSAPVGIFRTDPEGNCLYVNPRWCEMAGLSPQEAEGQGWLRALHPEDRDRIAPVWYNTTQANLPFSAEYRFIRPDGSITWVYGQAVAEKTIDGAIMGYVGTLTDITERLRIEEIRRTLERQKELNELKLRFFSMASHEFRTPLSIILFAAQVLENSEPDWLDAKKLRNIHRIQDVAKNMAQMLTDVLTLARAEAQKIAFNPQPVNLQQFCIHILEEIEASHSFSIPIQLTYEGESGNVSLDDALLHSILLNLLSNAIKYSPQGGNIDFKVACEAEAAIFTIRDQGMGIPLADQAHLFEAFHRGENVGSIEGSGLGLAVVKRAVDLHGGQITVQSCVGHGTTFIVRIPIGSTD